MDRLKGMGWSRILKALPFERGPSSTRRVYRAQSSAAPTLILLFITSLICVVFAHSVKHHIGASLLAAVIAIIGILSTGAVAALKYLRKVDAHMQAGGVLVGGPRNPVIGEAYGAALKIGILVALMMLGPMLQARAQMVPVVADSCIVAADGTLLGQGTFEVQRTDGNDNPVFISTGGFQLESRAVRRNVLSGSIVGSLNMSDPSILLSDAPMLRVTIYDSATKKIAVYRRVKLVLSGSIAAFDWCNASLKQNFAGLPFLPAPKGSTGADAVVSRAGGSGNFEVSHNFSASLTGGVKIDIDHYGESGASLCARANAAKAAWAGVSTKLWFLTVLGGTFDCSFTMPVGATLELLGPVTSNAGGSPAVIAPGGNRVFTGPGVTISMQSEFVRLTGDGSDIGPLNFSSIDDMSHVAGVYVDQSSGHHIHDIASSSATFPRAAIAVDVHGGSNHSIERVQGKNTTWAAYLHDGVGYSSVAYVDCAQYVNCVEVINGDADYTHGGPSYTSRAAILAMPGNNDVAHVRCRNVTNIFSACAWGGVTHHLEVSYVDSVNAGDMAVDCEACADSSFSHVKSVQMFNTGAGIHACAATYWFASNILFDDLDCRATAGNVGYQVQNFSGNLDQVDGVIVRNSRFHCEGPLGSAVGGDRFQNLQFVDNKLTDCQIGSGSESGAFQYLRNSLLYTKVQGRAFYAIRGPNIQRGFGQIADNVIKSVLAQPAGSVAVYLSTSALNDSPNIAIRGNTFLGSNLPGSGGFPVDISTVNTGRNPGTNVVINVADNYMWSGVMTHTHPGSNHDHYTDLGQYHFSGSRFVKSTGMTRSRSTPACEDATGLSYKSASTIGCVQ